MENQKAKDFCLHLLHAETEEEVIEILKKNDFWADRTAWKAYGDIQNNRGIVGNQQSSSVAALVEKLVNSIDAVLTCECLRKGIDPTSSLAPKTMRKAAEIFFGLKEGKIQNIDASERTTLAEKIQLVACGTRENPAYMIIDDGEGQYPDEFPSTFLSLVRENKTKIPFVQGKFNQGGTGVLQFSGAHSFQLIISKRQPDITNASKNPSSNSWGMTITRRLEPSPDQPQSMYVYLAPNGRIISFDADSLPVRPGRYPENYKNELNAGTCIKVWNYKLRGGLKTIATLDLRYELERCLYDPVLPIRIYERRSSYKAHTFETTASGLATVLSDKRENLEFSDASPLIITDVGKLNLKIAVVKEEISQDDRKRYLPGLFFIVNGQLHSELSKDFISRKTKLDDIADTMIIVVDCTELPQLVREDLFMSSRDRMRQCDERDAIESEIVEYIRDHPGLRELNALRRQKRLSSAMSEEETAKILQSLVRSDPTLAQLFGKGETIKIPGKDIPTKVPYEGRKFPTFFRIHNEPKEGLIKLCPRNRHSRLECETDAENGYFDRLEDRGHLESHGIPHFLSQNLWNGKATINFSLPPNVNIGDTFKVDIDISDISRMDPFIFSFNIKVEPEAIGLPTGPHQKPLGSATIGLPIIDEVYRDRWGQYNFNEFSALKIHSGENDALDIAVNMDNIYLRNEIAKRKNIEGELIKYWFKWGMILLALGMLNHQKKLEQNKDDEDEAISLTESESSFSKIEEASEGLAITLIPVIYQLRKDYTASQ